MNFPKLNAENFEFNSENYCQEFEQIITKIVLCYQLMIGDSVVLINDENKIRDVLVLKYLKNNKIREDLKLINYLFDREVPEDQTPGRTDIKVQTINTFKTSEAYYIIECKRINSINPIGSTGLNSFYISNGISRFISDLYSSYYKVNGMIGFVIDKVDINKNIEHLNNLLTTKKETNTISPLTKIDLLPTFSFNYVSEHSLQEGIKIKIYHIMFDFSDNIK